MFDKMRDKVLDKVDLDRDDYGNRLFFTIGFWVVGAIVIFIALQLVMLLYISTLSTRMEYYRPVCLMAGYSDIKITYDYNLYCVTRQNQTDVVVPIDDVAKPE